jgi:nucleoside-diphosphate-sugar epimerase
MTTQEKTLKGHALVTGATGVTGTPFVEQLLALGWNVYGISRRTPVLKSGTPSSNFVHFPIDLRDLRQTTAGLRNCPDITHIFHCANTSNGEERKLLMENLLSATKDTCPSLRNINLMQGMKYYGCHLGPFKVPAYETDPRRGANPYYYDEEDLIAARQRERNWTWTTLRPHSVCGYSEGNSINLAVVLAVYCAIMQRTMSVLPFPGSDACFRSLFQVVDAELLARAAIYVSTRQECGNNAFNINNDGAFRWESLWPAIAGFFGMRPGLPANTTLSDFLSDKAEVWSEISSHFGLRPFPFDRVSRWSQGDYNAPNSRLACEYDIVGNTTKLRTSGFHEEVNTQTMFLRLFERYRDLKVIP